MMRISIFLLLGLFLLSACQSEEVKSQTITVEGGSYQNITLDELSTMLQEKDFVLVNVHIPFAGKIAGTDLFVPYDQIGTPEKLLHLPADHGAKIVLYCRSGRMSEIAAENLVSLGYTNVWNLTGGMVAWEQAGHELVKQP